MSDQLPSPRVDNGFGARHGSQNASRSRGVPEDAGPPNPEAPASANPRRARSDHRMKMVGAVKRQGSATSRISRMLGRNFADVVAIGQDFRTAKKLLGHEHFANWAEREFGLSQQLAKNYMRTAAWSDENRELLPHLPVGAVYLLSASSTPRSTTETVAARIAAGESVSAGDIRILNTEAREARRQEKIIGQSQAAPVVRSEPGSASDVSLDAQVGEGSNAPSAQQAAEKLMLLFQERLGKQVPEVMALLQRLCGGTVSGESLLQLLTESLSAARTDVPTEPSPASPTGDGQDEDSQFPSELKARARNYAKKRVSLVLDSFPGTVATAPVLTPKKKGLDAVAQFIVRHECMLAEADDQVPCRDTLTRRIKQHLLAFGRAEPARSTVYDAVTRTLAAQSSRNIGLATLEIEKPGPNQIDDGQYSYRPIMISASGFILEGVRYSSSALQDVFTEISKGRDYLPAMVSIDVDNLGLVRVKVPDRGECVTVRPLVVG